MCILPLDSHCSCSFPVDSKESTWAGGSMGAFSCSEWGRSNMPAPIVCRSTLYIISLFILKHCLWEIQVKVTWTLGLVIYSHQLTIEEDFVWQPWEVLPWPSHPWWSHVQGPMSLRNTHMLLLTQIVLFLSSNQYYLLTTWGQRGTF